MRAREYWNRQRQSRFSYLALSLDIGYVNSALRKDYLITWRCIVHKETVGDPGFWDRYIEVLQHAAVPEKARRWYVIRIERYVAAHPQPLADHTA
jgi:hypothetical protein